MRVTASRLIQALAVGLALFLSPAVGDPGALVTETVPPAACPAAPPAAGSSLTISQARARAGDVITLSIVGVGGETAAVAFSRANSGASFQGRPLALGPDLGLLFTCRLSGSGSCSQRFTIPPGLTGTFFFQAARASDPTFQEGTSALTNGACLSIQAPAGAFELHSPAFSPGGEIPVRHTCDGPDVSPPLRWSDPPPNTRGFALVLDDPDAPGGTFGHWVLYGLPATLRDLPEGVPPQALAPNIGTQGTNDFGSLGYGGPCPPPEPPHRYVFTLFALDAELVLSPGLTKSQVLRAIAGRVVAQAELVGRFGR
jgi:Raf kinase inhibitor-like YbhB/YbcL family protein